MPTQHWKKQAALEGPCTNMTGFTRLVAAEDGAADGMQDEMPSIFVPALTQKQLAQFGHFGVMNRPFSVVQFIAFGGLERIPERFVYIAETDHVLMRPLPNLATESTPAAFSFGYMHCRRCPCHSPSMPTCLPVAQPNPFASFCAFSASSPEEEEELDRTPAMFRQCFPPATD